MCCAKHVKVIYIKAYHDIRIAVVPVEALLLIVDTDMSHGYLLARPASETFLNLSSRGVEEVLVHLVGVCFSLFRRHTG